MSFPTPSELPHAAAARRLWIHAGSPHQHRLAAAAPWVARWRDLGRRDAVAIAWDATEESSTALWVATRMGLSVTVVSPTPMPTDRWSALDDQCVTYGGSITWVQALPVGQPVVRPAA